MNSLVITCPECRTSYKTSAASIGERGRNVRCARCTATWFVPPPDIIDKLATDPDALALAETMAAARQPRSEAQPPDPKPVQTQTPVSQPVSTAPDWPAPPQNVPPASDNLTPEPTQPVGADVMMRDKADSEKLARRRRTIQIIWVVPVLIVIVAAIAAWFNRQEIVNRLPQTASVYRMLGAEVRTDGLEIDPPDARTILVDGAPVIRIESAIRNLTREPKTVPLIELSLHDDAGLKLAQWYVESGATMIAGGDRTVFTTEYVDPPEGVVGLRYRFVRQPS